MQITLDIPSKRLADLMVSAFEGATTYWAQAAHPSMPLGKEYESPWYSDPKFWEGSFSVDVRFDDPAKPEGNGKGRKTIGPDDVKKGFELMATKYGHHFGEFMRENEDAETADVFLQCVVLGDLVYG